MKRSLLALAAFLFFMVVASMSLPFSAIAPEEIRAMTLENSRIQATFSAQNGRLVSLLDKQRAKQWILAPDAFAPFTLATQKGMHTPDAAFSFESAEPDVLRFLWRWDGGSLRAVVTLLEDGLRFQAALQNSAESDVHAFEYPIVGALADFEREGYYATSWATGLLVSNPQANLPQMEATKRLLPYPEGFSGHTMQFFTYYHQDAGGLYFVAPDAGAHQKWLNFYKDNGRLAASHMYGFENVGKGSALSMPYSFEVRFTDGRGWQEAAQRYKAWAMEQPWAARGLAAYRAEEEQAEWLLRGVGAATFGIDASHDRTLWLDRYRADLGVRIFHILGPDWTKVPQNFYNSLPGDLPDWAPVNFNAQNLENLKAHGDPFAAFEFDFFVGLNHSNPKKLLSHLQRFPSPTYSHDGYTFTMLCPADPFTRDFHREKNLMMLEAAGMDAMYYDISANNLIKICMSESHGHATGGGYEIAEGYRDVYRDTKTALDAASGRYIPLGTEMINETLLGELDYYQARSWAQPSSTLEFWPVRDLLRSGKAQVIPLFDYVYHELGVVRLDGWGKLVEETGSYFRFIVSRVYLWGGLYELNYEYSPMEAIDGAETAGSEHYFHFDPQGYAYSPDRAAYLRQFAQARVGKANRYWAFGMMTAVPDIEIKEVYYDWYHYNHGQADPSYKARGSAKAPAVVASAFRHPQGGWALFLSNAHTSEQALTVPLSRAELNLPAGDLSITLMKGFGQEAITTLDLGMLPEEGETRIQLSLDPLTLYMLEIKSIEQEEEP